LTGIVAIAAAATASTRIATSASGPAETVVAATVTTHLAQASVVAARTRRTRSAVLRVAGIACGDFDPLDHVVH
jgi:hypothetical protein